MLGMHGTLEANLAMHHADLVLAVGARFDDRVTGQLKHFCPQAKVVHLDIDPASIHKVVRADVGLVGDAGRLLGALLDALQLQQLVLRCEVLNALAQLRPHRTVAFRGFNGQLRPLDAAMLPEGTEAARLPPPALGEE